ncbi:MAG TPA: hypothetical protein VFX18_03260 [Candidatus Nitrosocosmicus sp.]|nr:hypothetical protein [Candidatus Nitrosocosmicus sp.]
MSVSNPTPLPTVLQTGGVQFTTSCFHVPTPGDPGTGGGGDGVPGASGQVDSYGVAKIFPDLPGARASAFYMDMLNKSNNTRFNISYGTGSHLTYNAVTEGNLHFYNSTGAVQHYASGNEDSRSCRLDMYPSGGIWGNNTNYSYKSNPGYLYQPNSFANKEITIYARPHGRLGTHEAFSFKMQGRDQDDIRSCIEMVYATGTHSDVVVNVEYKHFPYVSYNKVRQYNSTSSSNIYHENTWIGVKCILIIADNKRSAWLGMYEDLTPFTSDGKPANHWKLRADCLFTGVSDDDYDNIIPTWDPHKDVIRLDGYSSQDFMWVSDRPIDKSVLKDPQALKPSSGWSYGATPQFNPIDFDTV